jgi:hypothetical protein
MQGTTPPSYYADAANVDAYHSLIKWSGVVAVVLAVGSVYEVFYEPESKTEVEVPLDKSTGSKEKISTKEGDSLGKEEQH